MTNYELNKVREYKIDIEKYSDEEFAEIIRCIKEYEAALDDEEDFREDVEAGIETNENFIDYLEEQTYMIVIELQKKWGLLQNMNIPKEFQYLLG